MIPKKNRLHRSEFSFVWDNGKTLNTDSVRIKYVQGQKNEKYSVVVSKKVAKSAVKRHLIKRRVYNAAKEIQNTILKGCWSVYIVKPGQENYSYKKIKESFENIGKKV